MAISYGTGWTPNSAAASSLVIQPPAVYAAGNLLVMCVIAAGSSGGVAASTPAGWTAVSAGGATLAVFTKTAGSSETAVTVTLGASSVAGGFIAAYPAATATSSFANSGAGQVSWSPTFPGGVTAGQTVLLLAGSVAGAVTAYSQGVISFDNASQNVNLPPTWAVGVPAFGPVLGSNNPSDNGSSLPVAVGLAEFTGPTSNPGLTVPVAGTIYAGFLVLTVTGSAPAPYEVTATATGPAATVGIAVTVKQLAGAGSAGYQAASRPATKTFAAGGVSQAPDTAITPVYTGSIVYGAVTENQGVTPGNTYTAAAGTTFSQNVADAVSSAIYGTFQTGTTTAATPVTAGGSAPSNTQVVGALAEIRAATGTSITETATGLVSATQTGQYPSTTAAQTAVLPSAPGTGAVVVALVSANSAFANGNAAITVTDTAGLIWAELAAVYSPAYAGVWIASPVPAVTPGHVIFDQAAGDLNDQAGGQILEQQSAPAVTTLPPTGLTLDPFFVAGATLNGTITPYGTTAAWTFQWGLTVDYGNSVSGSTSVLGPVSATVGGLAAGQQYHCRLSATNSLGTTTGGDVTFTALAPQPGPVLPGSSPAGNPAGQVVLALPPTSPPGNPGTQA